MGNLLRRLGWITWVVILGFVSLATGVATNQVLNNGQWNRTWLVIAICCAVLLAAITVLGARFGTPDNGARGLANGKLRRLYLKQTHASVRYMEAVGFPTRGPFSLDMRHVYVDVSLMPRTHDAAGEPFVGAVRAAPGERRSLRSFLETGSQVLVVIGGPGSGKTTMVRHTTLEMTRARRLRRRERIPVLLHLRAHAAALTSGNPPTLAKAAVAASWLDDRVPPEWLRDQLDQGRCLVLFDGLDEIADAAGRARVAAWVKQQIARHPDNQYVLTSRPHGYSTDPIDTADVVQVRRFTPGQVHEFLHNWYLATERRATGTDNAEVTAEAARKADDLLERLRATPALTDLAANPLLLTMIANVHLYRGALPGGRADLYREMCDVLLHRRQEAKGLPDPTELRGGQKEHVVRHLAWTLMERNEPTVTAREALEIITPVLRQVTRRLSPAAFLTACTESGLLVEPESGRYAFAHLTLQEYLAAAHVTGPEQIAVLASNVDKGWWRETTLLWAANADATPVLRACLEANSVPALALAFDVLEEAQSVDDTVRDELEAWLNAPAEPGGERARLVGSVMATRLLRDVWEIGDGVEMCTRPVSLGLYQRFVLDEIASGHEILTGLEGGSRTPVSGLWDEDVTRFMRWMNKRIAGHGTWLGRASCRLPNENELRLARASRLEILTQRPAWTSVFDGPKLDFPANWRADATLRVAGQVPRRDLRLLARALVETPLPDHRLEDYARGLRLAVEGGGQRAPDASERLTGSLLTALFHAALRDHMVLIRTTQAATTEPPPPLEPTARKVVTALEDAKEAYEEVTGTPTAVHFRLPQGIGVDGAVSDEKWFPEVVRLLELVPLPTPDTVSGHATRAPHDQMVEFVRFLPELIRDCMNRTLLLKSFYPAEDENDLPPLQEALTEVEPDRAPGSPDEGDPGQPVRRDAREGRSRFETRFDETLLAQLLQSAHDPGEDPPRGEPQSLLLARWAARVLSGCRATASGYEEGTVSYVEELADAGSAILISGQETGTRIREALGYLHPTFPESSDRRCARMLVEDALDLLTPVLERRAAGDGMTFAAVRLALLAAYELMLRDEGGTIDSESLLKAYRAVSDLEFRPGILDLVDEVLMLVRE